MYRATAAIQSKESETAARQDYGQTSKAIWSQLEENIAAKRTQRITSNILAKRTQEQNMSEALGAAWEARVCIHGYSAFRTRRPPVCDTAWHTASAMQLIMMCNGFVLLQEAKRMYCQENRLQLMRTGPAGPKMPIAGAASVTPQPLRQVAATTGIVRPTASPGVEPSEPDFSPPVGLDTISVPSSWEVPQGLESLSIPSVDAVLSIGSPVDSRVALLSPVNMTLQDAGPRAVGRGGDVSPLRRRDSQEDMRAWGHDGVDSRAPTALPGTGHDRQQDSRRATQRSASASAKPDTINNGEMIFAQPLRVHPAPHQPPFNHTRAQWSDDAKSVAGSTGGSPRDRASGASGSSSNALTVPYTTYDVRSPKYYSRAADGAITVYLSASERLTAFDDADASADDTKPRAKTLTWGTAPLTLASAQHRPHMWDTDRVVHPKQLDDGKPALAASAQFASLNQGRGIDLAMVTQGAPLKQHAVPISIVRMTLTGKGMLEQVVPFSSIADSLRQVNADTQSYAARDWPVNAPFPPFLTLSSNGVTSGVPLNYSRMLLHHTHIGTGVQPLHTEAISSAHNQNLHPLFAVPVHAHGQFSLRFNTTGVIANDVIMRSSNAVGDGYLPGHNQTDKIMRTLETREATTLYNAACARQAERQQQSKQLTDGSKGEQSSGHTAVSTDSPTQADGSVTDSPNTPAASTGPTITIPRVNEYVSPTNGAYTPQSLTSPSMLPRAASLPTAIFSVLPEDMGMLGELNLRRYVARGARLDTLGIGDGDGTNNVGQITLDQEAGKRLGSAQGLARRYLQELQAVHYNPASPQYQFSPASTIPSSPTRFSKSFRALQAESMLMAAQTVLPGQAGSLVSHPQDRDMADCVRPANIEWEATTPVDGALVQMTHQQTGFHTTTLSRSVQSTATESVHESSRHSRDLTASFQPHAGLTSPLPLKLPDSGEPEESPAAVDRMAALQQLKQTTDRSSSPAAPTRQNGNATTTANLPKLELPAHDDDILSPAPAVAGVKVRQNNPSSPVHKPAIADKAVQRVLASERDTARPVSSSSATAQVGDPEPDTVGSANANSFTVRSLGGGSSGGGLGATESDNHSVVAQHHPGSVSGTTTARPHRAESPRALGGPVHDGQDTATCSNPRCQRHRVENRAIPPQFVQPVTANLPHMIPRLAQRTMFNTLPSVARTMARTPGREALHLMKLVRDREAVLRREGQGASHLLPEGHDLQAMMSDSEMLDTLYDVAKGRLGTRSQQQSIPSTTAGASITSDGQARAPSSGPSPAKHTRSLLQSTAASIHAEKQPIGGRRGSMPGVLLQSHLQGAPATRSGVLDDYLSERFEARSPKAQRAARRNVQGAIHGAAEAQAVAQQRYESELRRQMARKADELEQTIAAQRAQLAGGTKPPPLRMTLPNVDYKMRHRPRSVPYQERAPHAPGAWLPSDPKYEHTSIHNTPQPSARSTARTYWSPESTDRSEPNRRTAPALHYQMRARGARENELPHIQTKPYNPDHSFTSTRPPKPLAPAATATATGSRPSATRATVDIVSTITAEADSDESGHVSTTQISRPAFPRVRAPWGSTDSVPDLLQGPPQAQQSSTDHSTAGSPNLSLPSVSQGRILPLPDHRWHPAMIPPNVKPRDHLWVPANIVPTDESHLANWVKAKPDASPSNDGTFDAIAAVGVHDEELRQWLAHTTAVEQHPLHGTHSSLAVDAFSTSLGLSELDSGISYRQGSTQETAMERSPCGEAGASPSSA